MESKLTRHRQAVLDIVKSSKDHPTAREVFEHSARHTPRLSFATVYNALRYLTENGHIRQLRFGDEAVRYDPMLERHDHLICRRCGRVLDALGPEPAVARGGFPAVEGFEVEEVTVQYLGLCGDCRGPEGRAREAVPVRTRRVGNRK